MPKLTSRVFIVWDELAALMSNPADWPTHPVALTKPRLSDAGVGTNPPSEVVVVTGTLQDQANQSYVTQGSQQSRDERFTLRIAIMTSVPAIKSAAQVRARLEVLAATCESLLRDENGKPAGIVPTPANGVLWHEVAQITPQLFPTAEGYEGHVWVDVAFRTRL